MAFNVGALKDATGRSAWMDDKTSFGREDLFGAFANRIRPADAWKHDAMTSAAVRVATMCASNHLSSAAGGMTKPYATLKNAGVFDSLARANKLQGKMEKIVGGTSWDLADARVGTSIRSLSKLYGLGGADAIGSSHHHLTQKMGSIAKLGLADDHALPWIGAAHRHLLGASSKFTAISKFTEASKITGIAKASEGVTDTWRSVLTGSAGTVLRDLDASKMLHTSSAGALMRLATHRSPEIYAASKGLEAYEAQIGFLQQFLQHRRFDVVTGTIGSVTDNRADLARLITGIKNPPTTVSSASNVGIHIARTPRPLLVPEQEEIDQVVDVEDLVVHSEPLPPETPELQGAWKLLGPVELWLHQLDEGPLVVQVFYKNLGRVVVGVIIAGVPLLIGYFWF